MAKKKKERHLLAMWCNEGLECVIDITSYLSEVEKHNKEVMWATLKGDVLPRKPSAPPLQQMILRAQFNVQREYEIYEFNSNFSVEEVKSIFEDSPQIIVDWIRENGFKIHSDYTRIKKRVIT